MDRVSYGPFKLYESDAYKQARAMQAEKAQLELEKLQLDLAEKRREQELSSPSGRATRAAEVAAFLEQEKQRKLASLLARKWGQEWLPRVDQVFLRPLRCRAS